MKLRNWFVPLTFVLASQVNAYPVDPNKVPVKDVDQRYTKDFKLAYDSIDKNIVYYAPMGGRVAIMNGQPLLGFAFTPSGGFVNAQFEFGVFGDEREKLFDAIHKAGYTARPFPYVKTSVKPVIPIDPETGEAICETFEDLSTGKIEEDCSNQIYTQVTFSKNGPSLGEYIPITLQLTSHGAAIYKQFLKSGNALQIQLDADYYAAGTGFKAKVIVNYEKLIESFHAYAAYHDGVCVDIEVEAFWKKEGLCNDKDASECSIRVEYTDDRGNEIDNVTVDPNSEEAAKVLQAVDRLKDLLQDDMLTPIAQKLGPADTSKPRVGFKLSAKFERQKTEKNAEFEFNSPIGVNLKTTVIPAAIACLKVSESGNVSRDLEGDCRYYWQGSLGWEEIIQLEQAGLK